MEGWKDGRMEGWKGGRVKERKGERARMSRRMEGEGMEGVNLVSGLKFQVKKTSNLKLETKKKSTLVRCFIFLTKI